MLSLSNITKNARPVLQYDFNGVSSTIVPDISGTGSAGVIRGHDRGGAYIKDDIVFGKPLSVLNLTGGVNGGFLQMPDGIINHEKGITISFYCKIYDLDSYGTICSFGKDHCFYLSAIPDAENEHQILLSPAATMGGRSQESALMEWVSVKKDIWFHVILIIGTEPNQCDLYIDGSHAGCFELRRMTASDLFNCTDCYFGNGALSQNPLRIAVTQILIFHHALPEYELSKLFDISDEARIALEFNTLSSLFPDAATNHVILPKYGSMNTVIKWESLTPHTVSDEGEITRPEAGCPDTQGTLRAHISYKSKTGSKDFVFNIAAFPEDSVLAEKDVNLVSIPFPGHIVSDLVLPQRGEHGTIFTWSSNHDELLTTDGKVSRPQIKPGAVTLTLTGAYKSAVYSRDFKLTIWPIYGQAKQKQNKLLRLPRNEKPMLLAEAVPMQQIDLAETALFYDNQQRCLNYLLLLDADRLLFNFRRTFGKDTGASLPLGGWEEPAGLLRGHSTGHFLSALALAFAATRNEKLFEKASYIINELRMLQLLSEGDPAQFKTKCTPSNAAQSLWSHEPKTWGEGYLSAYSPDQFALLEQYTPYATIWAPYYTLHKLLAGFLDCYIYMHHKTALDCARGIGDWIYRRLSVTTEETRSKMWGMYIAGEYGGINESLARLYQITDDHHYLMAAKMFDNPKLFNNLADGIDAISGIHANQHIPQIIGAIEEYRATGDTYYYRIAQTFWELVVNHYAYSIGGVGRGENFKEPDVLAGNIEGDRNCETCASYNMLKLTGMLYQYHPEISSLMDYYERTVINHIAASQNPIVHNHRHNGVTYMLPIGLGARKEYSNDYDDFTCCHGTGMENHVRYSENIYHLGKDHEALFINLFISSTFHCEEKGFILTQKAHPLSEYSTIIMKGSARLKLYIRIPYWCRNTFKVSYNNRTVPVEGFENYYVIDGDFKDHDRIELYMPHKLHLCYTQDDYEGYPVASLMYGPVVMTAISKKAEWLTLNLPPVLEEAFVIEKGDSLALWYDDLKFVPMYEAHNVYYHTYFKVNLL